MTAGSFTLPRSAVRDQGLSIDSVGLLAWLSSHSDRFVAKLTEMDIIAGVRVGRDRARRMIRELVTQGYLLREKLTDRRGLVTGVRYALDRRVNRQGSLFDPPVETPSADGVSGVPADLGEQDVSPAHQLDGFSGEHSVFREDTREVLGAVGVRTARETPAANPAPQRDHEGTTAMPKRSTPMPGQRSLLVQAVTDPEPSGPPARRGHPVVAGWVDYCAARGVKLPRQIIGQYARGIATALADGFDETMVKHTLAGMLADGIANRPSLLANRLVAAQTGPEVRRAGSRLTEVNGRMLNQASLDDLAMLKRLAALDAADAQAAISA